MTTKIIDTHQHLWDLTKLDVPWVNKVDSLNRSFLVSDYAEATRKTDDCAFDYRIEKTIYMEVDVAESNIKKEIDTVVDLIRNPENSICAMIAATRPGEVFFGEILEIADSTPEIVGFRQVLHTELTPKGFCLQPEFLEDVSRLAETNKTFDICIRSEELADAKAMAQQCHKTQFVLDHCGNVDTRMTRTEMEKWKKDIRSIAELENVACKVSGFVWTIQNQTWSNQETIHPILEHVSECFGEDRLLFGGDWPVCTLSSVPFPKWLESIHEFASQSGTEFCEKLFHKNATRIYL